MIERHRMPAVLLLTAALLAAAAALAAVAPPADARVVPGDTIWSRAFSASSLGDAFMDVARGPGDVLYCVGLTRATEESNSLVLVKYKAGGVKAWAQTYQWPGRPGSAGAAVEVDHSGNVLVAGSIGVSPLSSSTGRDIVVLKFAPSGERLWVCTYDGPAHKDDYPTDMAVDSGGTAYVVGTSRGVSTGQDYALIAVRSDGELKWTYRYAGPVMFDYPNAIALDDNASSYITGSSEGAGGAYTAATVKVSHAGHQVWVKRLQYGNGITHGNDIAFKKVGGNKRIYICGGAMGSASTKMDLLVARISATTGAKVKDAEVDRSGDDDLGRALVVDDAGDAYAVGETITPPAIVSHALVARVNGNASVAWSRELSLVSVDNEASFQCVALSAGNLFCGGYAVEAGSGPQFVVQSVSTANDYRWVNITSGSGLADDFCRAIVTRPGGVFAAGQVTRTGSGIDGLLKKIAP